MSNTFKIIKNIPQIYTMDIVLKVVERCNLACPYCYYYFHEFDANDNQALISDSVIEQLPSFIEKSIRETNIRRFNICLHGGEPLLLKKERFRKICETLQRCASDGVFIGFSVQTNGVLIDEEWIDLFSEFNVGVGISIDGTPETHAEMRPKHDGSSSYEDSIAGLKLIQKAYKSGKLSKIGILSLVHPKDEEKVLSHIVNDLGFGSPGLNFPRGGWDSTESPEWDSHIDSHRKVIHYWIDNLCYPDFHYIRGISDIFLAIQSEVAAEYNDVSNAVKHQIVTISSDGRLLVDDNLFGGDNDFSQSDLNIFNHSLRDYIDGPKFQELIEAVDHKPLACEGCEWFRICSGGPLYNRFSKVTRFRNKAVICNTLKMIYTELSEFSLRINENNTEILGSILSTESQVTARAAYEALVHDKVVEKECE